jgi:hypothetical protein
MRASSDDPARSREATAKKREKSRSTSLAMRAWERERGKGDPRIYEREVLPRIQEMTVPELMKLTGLSQFHLLEGAEGRTAPTRAALGGCVRLVASALATSCHPRTPATHVRCAPS